MGVVSPQTELFAQPRPPSGTVFVNDRVCFQTEEKQRVVFVQGVVFAHYSIEDRSAEAYAMVQLFESGGVLLAMPMLVASGLLSRAEKIYGSLGLAFYGLRTTLVAYVLLALLRIPRPEALKEYPPGELGRIVGLDRMPEVKTLRASSQAWLR